VQSIALAIAQVKSLVNARAINPATGAGARSNAAYPLGGMDVCRTDRQSGTPMRPYEERWWGWLATMTLALPRAHRLRVELEPWILDRLAHSQAARRTVH
jgi:hypothetical protein